MRNLLLLAAVLSAGAAAVTPDQYSALRWRMIGPFRGGRTVAASGIAGQPSVFYVGANNGGVWKSTDYGMVWKPLFDNQPTGSIGAMAIAPSDPRVIYVGSGEGLHRPDLSVGDGIYKSEDGGDTWKHLGLRDGQQISAMVVDPRDATRLYVAVLGHPYGPNTERGLYRSTDGAKTFQKVLYKDENTGAVDIALDPRDPNTLYAVLWAARQGPWENGEWQGPGSGLFKSTDGGDTWRPLTRGLPTFAEGLGRIGIGPAASDPKRLYALVDAKNGGLYRSDDAGESWRLVDNEARIWGRGSDFACVRVDPIDPDTLYIANTSMYRSTDGGKTFRAIKGAPGGDDYHTIWINPNNRDIILQASDQGASVSVNRGETWSSWYNQPTAQFYHVITDNRFPYWVYGGQQESGSAAVASRGDNGRITFRDWHPVGVEEYGYVAPDPLDPNIIYGGKVSRYNQANGDVQQVGPVVDRGKHRFLRTAPLLFSPLDAHVLYLGGEVLWRTTNGAKSWDAISPDLSRESYDVPPSVGVFTPDAKKEATRRGVIYTVAPSKQDINTILVGTDDGLMHITRDGGRTWSNITPPGLLPWSKVSLMDASQFDNDTAYAAVNRFRCDDVKPHIYRTHDGGKTWSEIVKGLPDNEPVNAVREDPVRRGLLFAGTERSVHVSFDDGESWSPLRLNMPATSIRDLVIHENDLVVGTHGRGFWILDDMSPLRQLAAPASGTSPRLFEPVLTYRVRRNQNTDTPLPPEEPAGENPPDGAILYYSLPAPPRSPVELAIADSGGRIVRRYSSTDKADTDVRTLDKELTVMTEWTRPPHILPATPGMHRFVWDLRYAPPDSLHHEYPISAIWGDTPRYPLGPLVLPGRYAVRLTVDGRTLTVPLDVKMDPRVTTSPGGLDQQFRLSKSIYDAMNRTAEALREVQDLRKAKPNDALLAEFEGASTGRRRGGGSETSFSGLNNEFAGLLDLLQSTDAAPTDTAVAAVDKALAASNQLLLRWEAIRKPRPTK